MLKSQQFGTVVSDIGREAGIVIFLYKSITIYTLLFTEIKKDKKFYQEWWFLVIVALTALIFIIIVISLLCLTGRSSSHKYKGKNKKPKYKKHINLDWNYILNLSSLYM